MKFFWGTFLSGLALVGLFNLSIDPVQRWHKSRFEASLNYNRNWSQDEVFLTPENYDERLFVMAHLKVIPTPDIFIMGSSRCMNIDSWMFNENVSVFNAGMSGASVQDYICTWQSLKNQNKFPPLLVILLDPWVFNKNNDQYRWVTNDDLYTQFSGNRVLPFTYYLNRWKQRGRDVFDLFTWAILKQSFLAFPKNEFRTGIVKIGSMPPEAVGKRFDGSILYPVKLLQSPSLEEINEKAIKFTSGDVYSLSHWSFDEGYYQEMVRLLQDIQGHGIKTLIILPPYQHSVLKKLQELPKYKSILPSVVSTIANRLAREPETSFDFCNALDPVEDGCAETEFMDGLHMLRSCAEKVLKKCLPEFILDKKDSHISEGNVSMLRHPGRRRNK